VGLLDASGNVKRICRDLCEASSLHERNKILEERLAELEAMVAKMNLSLEGKMK